MPKVSTPFSRWLAARFEGDGVSAPPTRSGVARVMGIHNARISDWLHRGRMPTAQAVGKLARVLRLSPDEALDMLRALELS
jgi:plasmid maintenance system antidote protein VapI